MAGYVDDYGRVELEALSDTALYRCYSREVAPSRKGRDREWVIDRIVERRRQESLSRGDFRSKYYRLYNQHRRTAKKLALAEEKLEKEKAKRRDAMRLAEALISKLDKMGVEV